MRIRTELIKARKAAGKTQREVAAKAGIARASYSHIERGSRGLSLDVALKIANALGKSVNDIFLPSDVAERHNISSTGTDGP